MSGVASALAPTSSMDGIIYPMMRIGVQQLIVANMVQGVGIWFFYREQWQIALLNGCFTCLLIQPIRLLLPRLVGDRGEENLSTRIGKLALLFFSSAYFFPYLIEQLGYQVTILKTLTFTILSLIGVGIVNYIDKEENLLPYCS
jgi:hypothetical protein